MRTKLFFPLVICSTIFLGACKSDDESTGANNSPDTQAKVEEVEFDGVEVLFNEKEFNHPKAAELLKEIFICSDVQVNQKGELMAPCSPENFQLFPLQKDKPLEDGFVVLAKSYTGGVSLRRVLVFEREADGTLVKTNGFIANLIGMRKNKDNHDDLLLRFIDKIEGSDVYYNCIFKWENGKYEFKTVELIQEPAGDFSGVVKASMKDSVSKEIYKIILDNKMIF